MSTRPKLRGSAAHVGTVRWVRRTLQTVYYDVKRDATKRDRSNNLTYAGNWKRDGSDRAAHAQAETSCVPVSTPM
jgi:hypothetical protein